MRLPALVVVLLAATSAAGEPERGRDALVRALIARTRVSPILGKKEFVAIARHPPWVVFVELPRPLPDRDPEEERRRKGEAIRRGREIAASLGKLVARFDEHVRPGLVRLAGHPVESRWEDVIPVWLCPDEAALWTYLGQIGVGHEWGLPPPPLLPGLEGQLEDLRRRLATPIGDEDTEDLTRRLRALQRLRELRIARGVHQKRYLDGQPGALPEFETTRWCLATAENPRDALSRAAAALLDLTARRIEERGRHLRRRSEVTRCLWTRWAFPLLLARLAEGEGPDFAPVRVPRVEEDDWTLAEVIRQRDGPSLLRARRERTFDPRRQYEIRARFAIWSTAFAEHLWIEHREELIRLLLLDLRGGHAGDTLKAMGRLPDPVVLEKRLLAE